MSTSSREAWIGLVLLAVITAGAFWIPLASPEAVLDDAAFLAHDRRVRDPALRGRVWDTPLGWVHRGAEAPPETGAYYRPVPILTMGWVFGLAGEDPRPQRGLNLLVHLVLGGGLFLLLRSRAGPLPAGAAALVYLLHPVHAETVAFFSGRFDLMAVAFTVGAAAVLGRWPDRAAAGGAAGGLYLLACLSKESALPLGLFLPVWVWLGEVRGADQGGELLAPKVSTSNLSAPKDPTSEPVSSRVPTSKPVTSRVLRAAALVPLIWLLTFALRSWALGGAAPRAPDPLSLLAHAPSSLLVYLQHVLLPLDLQAFAYPSGLGPGRLATLLTLLAVLATAALLHRAGRLPTAVAALALAGLPLIPVLDPGLLPLPFSDRYLVGGTLAWAWVLGELLVTLPAPRRRAGALLVGLGALLLGSRLVARLPAFTSGRALVADLLARPELPDMLRDFLARRRAETSAARGPLATAHRRAARGDVAGALQELHTHLTRQPGDLAARELQAQLLSRSGREAEAKALFQELLRSGERPDSLVGLALIEAGAGDLSAARTLLDRALLRDPAHTLALRARAEVLERLGHPDQARLDRERAGRIELERLRAAPSTRP